MKNWQELAAICRTCNCSVQYAEPLRNHTTFRIGGACSAFVNVNSEETLRQILGLCRDRNYPYLVLGNGSNILAADSGYAGVILHLGKDFSRFGRTAPRCTVKPEPHWPYRQVRSGRIPDRHGVPCRHSGDCGRCPVHERRGIRRRDGRRDSFRTLYGTGRHDLCGTKI